MQKSGHEKVLFDALKTEELSSMCNDLVKWAIDTMMDKVSNIIYEQCIQIEKVVTEGQDVISDIQGASLGQSAHHLRHQVGG